MPIVLSTGEVFGTLCAIDPDARELSTTQADLLTVLGRIIATSLERDREAEIRTQAEAEQARLYQAAQDAIREREALLSIASHELKTPLTALLGYADLLQRHLRDLPQVPDRDHRAMRSIVTQAHRLNRLLTDVLDVSRIDRGHFSIDRRPMDLSLLVHTVVEEVHLMVTAHPITIEAAPTPILIAGDDERLAQVLRNLLSNAVKYSPGGGRIRVVVTTDGAQASLAIHDEGIGIHTEALPHLFQRFYRAPATSQAIQGLGIGLYVVKEIVTRHDGTISVTSTEGEGTTFTICLPILATPC